MPAPFTTTDRPVVLRRRSVSRALIHGRWFTCVMAAVLAVTVRVLVLQWIPTPTPVVHDEFAYLLGADTFASGRLANPPHPMWQHFETHHVLFQPSYASKYPPGQSLVLALGQWLFGHPWYGVLLSSAILCASICWMLQAWLPPPYPLAGALLALLQFGVTGYWVNSYWGGALAAIGGALVAGALPRLVRRPRAGVAVACAAGMLALANTRPYEGFVYVIASLAALLWWRQKTKAPLSALLSRRVVVPPAVVLAAGIAWMLYYNYRVTGSPWMLPTAHYQRLYSATSQFWLLPEGPPVVYRHEMIRLMWQGWFHGIYAEVRSTPTVLLRNVTGILSRMFELPLWALMGVAVVFARSRRVRVALAIALACAGALLLEINSEVHYFAPAVGLLVFLVLAGTRRVSQAVGGKHRRRTAVAALTVLLAGIGVKDVRDVSRHRDTTINREAVWREAIIRSLSTTSGRHLIIVRYAPERPIGFEWVFNRANIDDSAIVWAHDMGPRNEELLRYYPDRQAWLLQPDLGADALVPYPAAER